MRVADIKSIKIKLASPEEILSWSHGEVKKSETINYRTQKPEKDGLFCERIFGPSKDYECYCGKYKGIRYKEVVCDRCGVEITKNQVRRERMGHIKLATPISHIWFFKGIPSRIALFLDVPSQKLEGVIYFVNYIIEKVDEEAQKVLLKEIEEKFKRKNDEIARMKLSLKERKEREKKLKEKYLQTKEEILSIELFQILSELDYRKFSLKYGEIFLAGTGTEALIKIFEKINLKKEIKKLENVLEKSALEERKRLLRRLKFLQGMERNDIRPEWMFLKILPVLPPDLRPMVQLEGGRFASSDLNDLYRRVINRNNRLKYLLEISAPEVIIRNEKRMLQEAIDSLLDNGMRKTQVTTASTGGKRALKSLADVLAGKQGRFRKNLLGKRVDYSGRSVIASGPDLKLCQCGIPKIMALELFRPFVIKELLDKELAYNIKGASKFIDEKTDEVFSILDEVVKTKLVLLNRAPTLHRLGIQAFEPVLIEGEAIRIHPFVCKAFNADFDGDQMAVHLPLSKEAQAEARNLMMPNKNFLKPASGLPIVAPTLDAILGCYWLTGNGVEPQKKEKFFSSFEEAIMAHQLDKLNLRSQIKVSFVEKNEIKLIKTTCGRIIFNSALPQDFPFVNEQVDSKKLLDIISKVINSYSGGIIEEVLDKIKYVGFEYATFAGMTLGVDDFIIPPEKEKILQEKEKEVAIVNSQYKKNLITKGERSSKIIEIWSETREIIEKLVIKNLVKDKLVFSIIDSGARGSWVQLVQICGMKGLVSSPSGRIIEVPIKRSLKEGFNILEYFVSCHGARKGTADTALRTSASGYLTRRLIDVSHEVIVLEEDCGDTKGIEIFKQDADEVGQDFVFKIVGKIVLEKIQNPKTKTLIVKKDEMISWEKAQQIKEGGVAVVCVRSPLTCKTHRGVCQKCYGWDMGRNESIKLGEAVGITAAQAIGEPGTQLTMRTRHFGGVTSGGDITQGLPRVDEILEKRKLKGEGVVCLAEGIVKKIDFIKGEIIISSKSAVESKKATEMKYAFPMDADIYLKEGDKVSPGQIFSSGFLDLDKLFKFSGTAKTQNYIIKEIQRVYVGGGIHIHDKHLEVIVRQMFSRVKIVDAGDSLWSSGQVVSRAEFEEAQSLLEKEGKKKASMQNILFAISRVALTSDSFLSAASFQETSRVLIEASLRGEEDKLRGLKENVIIGRMLPIGTGFKKQ
jgi:DNA-directed RNA polymerase subunit beta'